MGIISIFERARDMTQSGAGFIDSLEHCLLNPSKFYFCDEARALVDVARRRQNGPKLFKSVDEMLAEEQNQADALEFEDNSDEGDAQPGDYGIVNDVSPSRADPPPAEEGAGPSLPD